MYGTMRAAILVILLALTGCTAEQGRASALLGLALLGSLPQPVATCTSRCDKKGVCTSTCYGY